MSFDLILPFLRPIEHLIRDDEVSEIMVNAPPRFSPSGKGGSTMFKGSSSMKSRFMWPCETSPGYWEMISLNRNPFWMLVCPMAVG